MLRRLWPWFLVLVIPAAASVQPGSPRFRQVVLSEREQQHWKTPIRASQFSDVPHVSARSRCENTQPPRLLPARSADGSGGPAGVKVKGELHHRRRRTGARPLILESAGLAGDRNVLQTVRAWRYRPATCNGVPTEAEGKIEFSRR